MEQRLQRALVARCGALAVAVLAIAAVGIAGLEVTRDRAESHARVAGEQTQTILQARVLVEAVVTAQRAYLRSGADERARHETELERLLATTRPAAIVSAIRNYAARAREVGDQRHASGDLVQLSTSFEAVVAAPRGRLDREIAAYLEDRRQLDGAAAAATTSLVRRCQGALAVLALMGLVLGIGLLVSSARREGHAMAPLDDRASAARRELAQHAVQLRFAQCDARVLVDNALHPFRGQALGRAIRLRSVVPIKLVIHADPERIQQVLQILLGVALKCARIGAEITTSVQVVDGWIRFAVADTGPNSLPDELTRMFDGDLSFADASVGVAPVLSRKLVEAHHGRMGVDTIAGRGSTFWFALPNQPVLVT